MELRPVDPNHANTKTVCRNGHLMSEARRYRKAGSSRISYCGVCRASWVKTALAAKRTPARQLIERCRKYGITPAGYLALVASQGEKCALCRGEWGTKGPQIDHCHLTGRVRGVLCQPCNTALGVFRDCPVSLQRAAGYVRL